MSVYPIDCVVSLNPNHVSRVKTDRKVVQFLYSQCFVISAQECHVVISKGLETPAGTRVRVLRVRVEVRIFQPLPNPYPQCG